MQYRKACAAQFWHPRPDIGINNGANSRNQGIPPHIPGSRSGSQTPFACAGQFYPSYRKAPVTGRTGPLKEPP